MEAYNFYRLSFFKNINNYVSNLQFSFRTKESEHMVWQIGIFTVGSRHDVNQTPENDQAGQSKTYSTYSYRLTAVCNTHANSLTTMQQLVRTSALLNTAYSEQFKAINTQLALEIRIVGEIVPNTLPYKKLNAEFVRHECAKEVTPVQKAG